MRRECFQETNGVCEGRELASDQAFAEAGFEVEVVEQRTGHCRSPMTLEPVCTERSKTNTPANYNLVWSVILL